MIIHISRDWMATWTLYCPKQKGQKYFNEETFWCVTEIQDMKVFWYVNLEFTYHLSYSKYKNKIDFKLLQNI